MAGANVQFDAIETLFPIKIPLPVYITQPELMKQLSPMMQFPDPPAGFIFTKLSITVSFPICINVPRTESSISARREIFALGSMAINDMTFAVDMAHEVAAVCLWRHQRSISDVSGVITTTDYRQNSTRPIQRVMARQFRAGVAVAVRNPV